MRLKSKRVWLAGAGVLAAAAAWMLLGSRSDDEADAPKKTAKVAVAKRKAADPTPLDRALDRARDALATLEKIDDYTCVFVKRERVDGKLLDQEKLEMQLRHRPFSVHMRFIEPASSAGQQAIYVEGKNDGKLLGHSTGLAGKLGWVALPPDGYLAMRDNRYPITEAGMKNLVEKLIELGETPGLLDGCTVDFDDQAQVDERPCTRIEISMPRPKSIAASKPKRKKKSTDFTLAVAKIFVDREWNVPVRFETYEWPDDRRLEARLVEQYAYTQLKFNQGLTDFDFDPTNPEYSPP